MNFSVQGWPVSRCSKRGLVVGSALYAEVHVLVVGKGRMDPVWHVMGSWDGLTELGLTGGVEKCGNHQQRDV